MQNFPLFMVHTSHNWFLCDPNDLIPAKYKGKKQFINKWSKESTTEKRYYNSRLKTAWRKCKINTILDFLRKICTENNYLQIVCELC